MTLTSGIVLYAVFWFVTLFMVLPLHVKNQEETGEVEPGTSPGAPDNPMMKRKLLWTTVIATAIWVMAFLVIQSEIITAEDITRWFGRPQG